MMLLDTSQYFSINRGEKAALVMFQLLGRRKKETISLEKRFHDKPASKYVDVG